MKIKELIREFPWDIAMLFLGIGLLVGGSMEFYNGFHNLDLAANMSFQGKEIADMVDHYAIGKTISLKDLYITGSMQMMMAFKTAIAGAFLTAAGGCFLIGRKYI